MFSLFYESYYCSIGFCRQSLWELWAASLSHFQGHRIPRRHPRSRQTFTNKSCACKNWQKNEITPRTSKKNQIIRLTIMRSRRRYWSLSHLETFGLIPREQSTNPFRKDCLLYGVILLKTLPLVCSAFSFPSKCNVCNSYVNKLVSLWANGLGISVETESLVNIQ